MPAENQPEAYIGQRGMHTYHKIANYHIHNPYTILDIQSIPYTFKKRYGLLTLQTSTKSEINRDGQPLTRTYYYGYTEARKNLPEKTPFGEKT